MNIWFGINSRNFIHKTVPKMKPRMINVHNFQIETHDTPPTPTLHSTAHGFLECIASARITV